MKFEELKKLRNEKKVVMILYPDDHVVYDDVDNVFNIISKEDPKRVTALTLKYGLDKAKRFVGFVMEIGNYWINGVVDADLANTLAKEWDVLDVLVDDLIRAFVKKYFLSAFET